MPVQVNFFQSMYLIKTHVHDFIQIFLGGGHAHYKFSVFCRCRVITTRKNKKKSHVIRDNVENPILKKNLLKINHKKN